MMKTIAHAIGTWAAVVVLALSLLTVSPATAAAGEIAEVAAELHPPNEVQRELHPDMYKSADTVGIYGSAGRYKQPKEVR